MNILRLFGTITILGFFFACGPGVKQADLVLMNGKIVTVDEARPDAQALAVRDGLITAVGPEEEIRPFIGARTEVIDLEGKLGIPGFIESHGHFLSLGRTKMRLDLAGAKRWDDIVHMVEQAARKRGPGKWILGRGWHQEKWDRVPLPNADGYPFHHALSDVSPDNPVYLTHASGHACIANAKAMELAGVTKGSLDPPGGKILRDENGDPIGVFRETAQRLISKALQESLARRTLAEIDAENREAALQAADECLSKGITSFHDAGSSFRTIDLFKEMAVEDELGLRLHVMVRAPNDELQRNLQNYRLIGGYNRKLTVRAIKIGIDGALGTHGAWMLDPYTDLPTSTGLNTSAIEDFHTTAQLAIDRGFQLCVHAIGDRANRETLNVYERVFNENPGKKDLRWRIEHAQHISAQDIPRLGKLGVIASMQAIHCTSDGPWVPKRIGDARTEEGAYVWQKLMKSGAVVTNGTDTPVEDVAPIVSFHAAVTRELKDGSFFYPEQRMSRMEALRSYTINGAYAAFEDGMKGSLTRGKLADITILSKDIMTVPEDEIPSAEVVYTIVGGKVMFRR